MLATAEMTDDYTDEQEPQDKYQAYFERPEAQDVQRETRQAEGNAMGLQCPHCHCTNFSWVRNTYLQEGAKARRRECRSCGKTFMTYETS